MSEQKRVPTQAELDRVTEVMNTICGTERNAIMSHLRQLDQVVKVLGISTGGKNVHEVVAEVDQRLKELRRE